MRKELFVLVALAGVIAFGARGGEGVDVRYRPRLFKRFGEHVNVPDGLAQDRAGNIYLAAPNFANRSYPGVIMRMSRKSGEWSVFTPALLHPETGRGAPMGMEHDDAGNLYYCDNQYFFDKGYKSRIIRVVVDKSGEPQRMEPVVENIKMANAIRIRGDAIYFTDTFFDLEGRNQGGVYRVPFSAFKNGVARLLPKELATTDPYCIGITATTPHHRGDIAAADGLCFDSQGNIYTGNFGDGHLYIMRNNGGLYDALETLVYDPRELPCVDGLSYDAARDRVIIADSERNAILYWDIKGSKLGTLWMNDDSDGSDGLLDQPADTLIWGNKLIIANFDLSMPGIKNKNSDSVHTLSVIELGKSGGFFSRIFGW